jgi:ribonuclease HI
VKCKPIHELGCIVSAEKIVELFTDGACRGNPGPGGWGVWMRYNGTHKELFGGEKETTNNRMELMAAIMGLESLTRPCHVRLTSDSKYVLQGITEWIDGWKKKGWKNAARKPVKNADLWKRLDKAREMHEVEWEWVRGHTEHDGNEMADELANRGADTVMED